MWAVYITYMANQVVNPTSTASKDEGNSNASDPNDESCRIYIGNMDTRITELQMIKILQKYGKLAKLDFLYNKIGPNAGRPRGYCFADFEQRSHAETVVKELNGKFALSRKLIVHWAYEASTSTKSSKSKVNFSAGLGAVAENPKVNISAEAKIRAIEAKLKSMQESVDVTTTQTQNQGHSKCSSSKHQHDSAPYQRPSPRSDMQR